MQKLIYAWKSYFMPIKHSAFSSFTKRSENTHGVIISNPAVPNAQSGINVKFGTFGVLSRIKIKAISNCAL